MIKAVIFDLDNCLSAADEVGPELLEPAFEAIRCANAGILTDAELELAFSDCWRHALDFVAAKHSFSGPMLKEGWDALARIEVRRPMRGYPDLAILKDLPVQRFLVTSGFRRLQESKIKALGIDHLFTAIHVDAIDEPGRNGKRAIFERILSGHGLELDQVLVVGDNPESEIEAGNQLGMTTVQIVRPGVTRSSKANRHIHGLKELSGLLGNEPREGAEFSAPPVPVAGKGGEGLS